MRKHTNLRFESEDVVGRVRTQKGSIMKVKQCDRIKSYMREFGSINPLEAFRDLGCMRLAARISDLRKKGVLIKDEIEYGENRYGERVHWKKYSLIDLE